VSVVVRPSASRTSALPEARGPLTEWLLACLSRPPFDVGPPPAVADDPLVGDDLHLALYLCYELHYRGLPGVDEGWEWAPSLLEARATLERAFVDALGAEVGHPDVDGDIEEELRAVIDGADGPSLSAFLLERGSLELLREFSVHRSAYQLKEADPHSWGLPRIGGRAKAALVEIQADEYGRGVEAEMHASLFAYVMVALGLDPTYGAYLDRLPGSTLATVNLVSLFGLHRRWRGALVGHLAVFEMTSVVPMGRYAELCRRLGLPDEARRFYDVHVVADALHQVVASRDLAAGFVEDEPDRAADVAFGARAVMAVEERFARALLDAWAAGRSSLLPAG
jgi:Iron-containing redox enzyme